METENQSITEQFRQFVKVSEELLPTLQPAPPVPDFKKFIEGSTPLIIEPIRSSLKKLLSRLETMRSWVVSHDLLRIAGYEYQEHPYTDLMAWALSPATHPDSALKCQRAWLDSFPFGSQLQFERPTVPRTQFWTDDGIPDLVLEYDKFVIVGEAKIGSFEHRTPSGTLQTIAYYDSVKRALGLDESKSIHIVFITPDRREAANPEAFNTTFADFSISIAKGLEGADLPEDLKWTYAMLLTHFITCAVPSEVDTYDFIHNSDEWLNQLNDDNFLIRRFDDANNIVKLFNQEVL